MSKPRILSVEDDVDFQYLLRYLLKDDYDITTTATAAEAQHEFSANPADIVLLDVGLPDMDGYQLCKALKTADRDEHSVFIFISGHDSLEQRLAGYSAGADDYIVKPVETDELKARIQSISKFQQGKRNLQAQEQFSREMAFKAMGEASQYGTILQFIKQATGCQSLRELALACAEICNNLSLNCCVQLKGQETLALRANGGKCSPIELELFEVLSGRGRIFPFGNRAMCNDRHVSLLITNLPSDDEKMGQIRDLLAAIVEAAEAAVVSLTQRSTLQQLLASMQSTLASVTEVYSDNKGQTTEIMDAMMREMEENLRVLGLTDEQEAFFFKLVNGTQTSLMKMLDHEQNIEEQLLAIVDSIKHSISR